MESLNLISECCDVPMVYHIWKKSDGSIGYEPWDYCPSCLDCCDGYISQPEEVKEKSCCDDNLVFARCGSDYGYEIHECSECGQLWDVPLVRDFDNKHH